MGERSASSEPARLAVACPKCGVGLRVSEADLGSTRTCPKCGAALKLPSRKKASSRLAEKGSRQEFGFNCQLCKSRIYARPDQVGQQLTCPDCHTANTVPKPVKKAPAPKPKLEDGYALKDENASVEKGEEEFSFVCRVCETLIYAKPSNVGKPTACPDCGIVLTIPKPQPKLVTNVVAEDPGIALTAAASRPEKDMANYERMVGDAAKELEQREKEKPKPPKQPFWTSVPTFPFRLRTLPFLIILVFLDCLSAYLFKTSLEMEGLAAILGILVMVASMLVGVICVTMTANYLTKILNWTAMGYPDVQSSGDFEIIEYVRQCFFSVNALAVAATPGVLIAVILQQFGLPWIFVVEAIVIFVSMFLLFPPAILSLIDNNSIFGVYSPFVLGTMKTSMDAWAKSYAWFVVLAVPNIGANVLLLKWPNPVTTVLVSVVLTATMFIYFRVLGRLAWVLDQRLPPASEPVKSRYQR